MNFAHIIMEKGYFSQAQFFNINSVICVTTPTYPPNFGLEHEKLAKPN